MLLGRGYRVLVASIFFVGVVSKDMPIMDDLIGGEARDTPSPLSTAPEPRGQWREAEDRAAVAGNPLLLGAFAMVGVS